MNESIGEDSMTMEMPHLRKDGYLEDEGLQSHQHSYEYDNDAYANQDDQDFVNNKAAVIQDSLKQAKRKKSNNTETQNEISEDRIPPTQPDEPEIGMFFFCIWETNPISFLNLVAWNKVLDIFIFPLLFGFTAYYLQIIASGCFIYLLLRIRKREITTSILKALFYSMLVQNLMFTVIFIIHLIDSTTKLKPGYVFYLVCGFFFWIMQNIAWDFQVIDSTELFLSASIIRSEPPKSLEDSFSKEQPEPLQKTKLKKRRTVTEE